MKTALALLVLSLALPLRSAETAPPTIVLIGGEPEYQSTNTLPAFQRYLETNFAFHCHYLERKETNDLPGLQALDRADLVILFLRRMTLPEEQLHRVQSYVRSGKPL